MGAKKRIGIVGGGITGLSAAYYLMRSLEEREVEAEIEIFESRDRLGGVINTEIRNDSLMEDGPDSLFTAKADALKLIDDLGLNSSIVETNRKKRRSLLACDGELHPLPDGFVMLAPSEILPFAGTEILSTAGKLRTVMDLFIGPRLYGPEESVAQFIRRRFGGEILEKIVQPMVGGIYVGDVEKLSAECTIPQFVELERTTGSIIAGLIGRRMNSLSGNGVSGARYGMFVSLNGGLGKLVSRLKDNLESCNFHFETRVSEVAPGDSHRDTGLRWNLSSVKKGGGSVDHSFDTVIMTLPASNLAPTLKSLDEEITCDLEDIPCASSVVVNFLYDRDQCDYDFNGFGFVVPEGGNTSIIAGSFTSIKYPGRCPDDKVMIRAFLGGVLRGDILEKSDEELVELAHKDLARFLNITGVPSSSYVSRWYDSMPQYQIGHKERVKRIFSKLNAYPGLYLAGNSYTGVGIPDCVASAKRAARACARYLSEN